MPAATNRAELAAIAEKEFLKLEKLLATVEQSSALRKDEDDTSVKDVVAHRAHWIELFFGWYEDGLADKEVFFPAEGFKWNELKRYNAELRGRQANLGFDDACSMLRESHARLLRFIDASSDEALYGGPMKGARNDWTPGRWAEAAGPSHYRSASKYVRSVVAADSRG